MTKISQTDRVLTALQKTAGRGVTQNDFLPGNVIDGGEKITRVSRCIDDLKNRGWLVEVVDRRDGFVVYVLQGRAEAPSAPVPIRTADGWVRVFSCRRCLGNQPRESMCCGPTESMLMSPINDPGFGCRAKEQEVRHAA